MAVTRPRPVAPEPRWLLRCEIGVKSVAWEELSVSSSDKAAGTLTAPAAARFAIFSATRQLMFVSQSVDQGGTKTCLRLTCASIL